MSDLAHLSEVSLSGSIEQKSPCLQSTAGRVDVSICVLEGMYECMCVNQGERVCMCVKVCKLCDVGVNEYTGQNAKEPGNSLLVTLKLRIRVRTQWTP